MSSSVISLCFNADSLMVMFIRQLYHFLTDIERLRSEQMAKPAPVASTVPPVIFTAPVELLRIALALASASLAVLVMVPPAMVTEPPALLLTVPPASVTFAEVMTVSAPEKAKTVLDTLAFAN